MRNASSFRPGWRDQSPQVEEHAQGQELAWVVRGGPFTRPVLAQSMVTVGMSQPDRTIIRRARVELLADGFGAAVDASAYTWFPALQWRGPVAIPGAGDHMEDVLAMVPSAASGDGNAELQRECVSGADELAPADRCGRCHTCAPNKPGGPMRMIVCPDCGNKRCPKANDHRSVCTGSNEPGQPGGAYPAVPTLAECRVIVAPLIEAIKAAAGRSGPRTAGGSQGASLDVLRADDGRRRCRSGRADAGRRVLGQRVCGDGKQ